MTDPDFLISPAETPAPARKPFARSALTAMIIGGIILALSGLCTGGFAISPLVNGQGAAEFFNFLIIPLMVGAIGIVPGLLLFFTGRHVRKSGASVGAGVIALVLALPLFVIPYLTGTNGLESLAPLVITALIGLLPLIWGIMLIRAALRDK